MPKLLRKQHTVILLETDENAQCYKFCWRQQIQLHIRKHIKPVSLDIKQVLKHVHASRRVASLLRIDLNTSF